MNQDTSGALFDEHYIVPSFHTHEGEQVTISELS